ncbi:MAG: polyprenyl synthetase family protein, partial [Clostridia bacterium]|nr:polyprenyl synthetase family protein [Clostridia bacterium]
MIDSVLREYSAKIDERLNMLCALTGQPYDKVIEASRYSLLSGGKRIRPIILLEFYKLCGGKDESAGDFACALEMVHTFSLIHDDLPCMDDDDMRRGKPSCHKAYGEDMALLAGDNLLNEAFLVASKTAGIPQDRVLKAITYFASAIGSLGMIGGQDIDTTVDIKDKELLFKMFSKIKNF